MLIYPTINPVAFHIFNWPVYWYGLMYLVGALGGWVLLSLRIRLSPRGFTQDQVSDVIFFGALGAIIGGRIGYVIFYETYTFLTHPWIIFQTWKGGMSFHGGLLGVLVALTWCTKKQHKSLLAMTDFICPVVPIGLGAGRIGNFINGELWGRVTNVSWGMVFPHAGSLLRHPSQLYEFALEGVAMFVILWIYSRKGRPVGAVSGLFAMLYSVFRFSIEFFREPDAPIGYWFGWLTEGQLLSIPLFFVGIILMRCAYHSKPMQEKKYETIS